MTLEKLAETLNKSMGLTGKELEAAVFCAASLYSEIIGRKDGSEYFDNRMKESWAQGVESGEIAPV